MLKISGKLLTTIESAIYKNDKGMPVTSKPKLQLLVQVKRANGNVVHELNTISVPQKVFDEMKNKLNQNVEIEVGIISKEKVSFYGI